MLARYLFVVLLVFTSVQTAAALSPGVVTLDFPGHQPASITITKETIAAYPDMEQDVTYMTSRGQESGKYKGVLLWSLIKDWSETLGHNEALEHTLTVTAADGYTIAFSVGEIAPDFGDTPILLATGVDGGPLPDGQAFRLVVPGDKRGARYLKDVVTITVN